jgi:hypothetical protein
MGGEEVSRDDFLKLLIWNQFWHRIYS